MNLVPTGNYIALKNKKHILFLTPGFPENEADTSCIPALQLFIKHLQSAGRVEITVIAFQFPYRNDKYLWNGVTIFSIGGENRKGLSRIWNWYKIYRLASEIHRYHPIDQIHSFWLTECALLGSKIAARFNLKHTCTLMGQDVLPENKYLSKIKYFPEIIALSHIQAQTLYVNTGIQAKELIPWGIEKVTQLNENDKNIDILGVGNLIPLKSYDRFIRIVEEVKKDFPLIYTEIVGEGPEFVNLQKLIEASNLAQNICLTGKISRDAVLEKMKQSKCFLHVSSFESFGMVLIEALSNGTKVFSTDVGIAGETDEITLIGDDADAALKIITFLKNIEACPVHNDYSIEKTVHTYLENVFLA